MANVTLKKVKCMDDYQFIEQLKAKIQRMVDREIDLVIDNDNDATLSVEHFASRPLVTVGANIFKYPGFGRIAVEYSVACIRQERQVPVLDFQVLLSRN